MSQVVRNRADCSSREAPDPAEPAEARQAIDEQALRADLSPSASGLILLTKMCLAPSWYPMLSGPIIKLLLVTCERAESGSLSCGD